MFLSKLSADAAKQPIRKILDNKALLQERSGTKTPSGKIMTEFRG